jgi:hypothetical protein
MNIEDLFENSNNIIIERIIVDFYFNGYEVKMRFGNLLEFREYQTGILQQYKNLNQNDLENLKIRLTVLKNLLKDNADNNNGMFHENSYKEAWGNDNWEEYLYEYTSGIISLMNYNLIDNHNDEMNGYTMTILYKYLNLINEPHGNAYVLHENLPEGVKPNNINNIV